jgi:hypothetical protein
VALEIGPGTATWALVTGPFTCRLFVASSIWARVRILPAFRSRSSFHRSASDFPAPNDMTRSLFQWTLVNVVGLPAALFAEATLRGRLPEWIWVAIFFAVLVPGVLWIFARLRSDDRLERSEFVEH